MQSDPASKPMAVTVYRLTTCPHCNAANGVTAIRCWSCDQPLSDKRWTGEVSEEELAPARDPALSDADFTFLDNDLLARRKQAAVDEAVATARTFESTRTLGHSAVPSLPHRPQVVERVDEMPPSLVQSQSQPQARLQARSQPNSQARLQAQPAPQLPPQARFQPPPPQLQSSDRSPWQPPEARPYDLPLDYDAPLPFVDPPPSLPRPSSDAEGNGASGEAAPSPFSVRGSAIGEAPGAAFKKRRPVEAIVLTLVLGAGLYAYLQPSESPDDASRVAPASNQPRAIDAEVQRLLDMSAPANSGPAAPATSSSPAAAPSPSPAAAPAAAQVAPVPVPGPVGRPTPAPVTAPVPTPPPAPASTVVTVPVAPAVAVPAPELPAVSTTGTSAPRPACAPNTSALGLC